MPYPTLPVAQAGLPEAVPDLIGAAGALVLLLMIAAIAGMVYKHVTGGIEWPEDRQEEEDGLRSGGEDDEWDYY